MDIEIKEKLLKEYKGNPKGWYQWLSNKKDLKEALRNEYPQLNDYKEMLYWLANDITDFPKCPTCGKPTRFIGTGKGYHKHCCCSCTQLDKEVRDKLKTTNLKLYGDKNYNNPDKARATMLERYGKDNAFKVDEIKEKIKKTNIIKYGAENPTQNKEIQKKIKKTLQERYGVNCGFKCGEKVNTSKGERELFNFVCQLCSDAIANDRNIISPLELDIYIPSLSIGIEYDGDYWHSLPNMKKRDNLKTKICKEHNIKLIRVTEHEWTTERQLVETILKEMLNKYE